MVQPLLIPTEDYPPAGSAVVPINVITSTATPPSMSTQTSPLDQARTGLLISTTTTAPLPHLRNLIRRILGPDLLPTPSSALPYVSTMRRPLSAILMAPLWNTTKFGSNVITPPPHQTTPHPLTTRTLSRPGSYEMRDRGLLNFLSPTPTESFTSQTTSK